MADIHPNWQSTDEADRSVPVRTATPAEPPKDPQPPTLQRGLIPVSRQPAAIAGILIALGVGVAIFAGSGSLSTVGETVIVRITNEGFSPSVISAAPGSKIAWVNEDAIAHILQSDEFCTRDNRCLVTPPIEPGATTSMLVTDDFSAGTYDYYSISRQNAVGRIRILTDNAGSGQRQGTFTRHEANVQGVEPIDESSGALLAASGSGSRTSSASTSAPHAAAPLLSSSQATSADSVSSSSPSSSSPASSRTAPPSSSASSRAPTSTSSISSPRSSSSSSSEKSSKPAPTPSYLNVSSQGPPSHGTARTSSQQIPTNPYTVGSTVRPPAGAGVSNDAKDGREQMHGGAPLRTTRPLSQPETGAAEWVTIILSLGIFIFATRVFLKRCVRY